MKMLMRRLTRLTNGFSKRVENHANGVALRFMHYNFARIHQTTRITPAMAANVSDQVWLGRTREAVRRSRKKAA
jgi:hypothetical protein